TSKLIDLNNVPGTQDKTHLGDVDYRRCLDCPPLQDDQCGQFVPDTMGGTCCKGGLLSVSPAGVPNVVSIGYTVTNGVVQGFNSNCTYTSVPAVVAGTSSGLLTITGACNLQQLYASLQTTSPTGAVSI